ncbi:S9 family peptidase [Pseudofulvibacter geojedonensis]|uniref:S9 family peptidase n=1 Tax=Pseudofulvibacter geojedonensis TaxID=1123758 RepID=A0ABW3I381_9FLAO
MKKSNTILAVLCLFITWSSTAQDKQFTLEEIWGGAFRTNYMDALHSMKDGEHYSVLNYDRVTQSTSVDKYSYTTLSKVSTIVDSKDIDNIPFFRSYTFSNDETKLLLITESVPVYRHSQLGTYYVYDTKTKKATLVSNQKIQEPTFSNDGSKVAYVYNNNIFYKNLETGKEVQVTFDGKKNETINGVTDWVYEEEFAFVRAFEWNKSGTKIAYLRFDEREVPEFSMDVYGNQLYQTQQVFKYPKAGEENSIVTLHMYDVDKAKSTHVSVNNYEYIPRIKWTNDANILSVQKTNRHQNKLELLFVNATDFSIKTVLTDTDEAYVDVTDNLTFLNDNSFIWTSEKDGYNHIYHYSKTGKLLNQVTKGNWEVTNYYGFNEKKGMIYYQSVENGSINRDVYAVNINGKGKKRLSSKTGTNNATFSASFAYYINTFSNSTTPYEFTLNSAKTGKVIKEIKNNQALADKLKEYDYASKEFSTIKINGNDLNMWTIKPKSFDASKKYPVLMYQYSGPGSQQVANRWNSSNDYWYYMLAEQGYIVVCIDGRGTGYKGRDFKKVTQKELGKYEVEDQISAAKELAKRNYVDADRIGIWGWSYGGFMSSNCLLKGNDVFKMAIAVAPVTSWRFYDTIYTERYMTTPQENASGYDDNSPINHVDKLKGSYLLVHGMADDNVHVQNAMRMAEALIQANKQFDYMVYPDKNHGIYGGNTRLHLYTMMTNFIKNNL